MGRYAAQHASALALLASAGAPITFTKPSRGGYDSSTDTVASPETTVTVAGQAAQLRGNPRTYERDQLVRTESPTLFFVPSTYGSLPEPGAACTWGGVTYVVRDVAPVAPDATALGAFITLER